MQAALNLPLLPLLSFWSDLDTDGRDSLYLSLFQNKAVLNPPDSAFQLQYSAQLSALPTLQFPSPLFPNLTYDPTTTNLSLNTAMSDDEYTELLQLLTDSSFTAAVNFLRKDPFISGTGYAYWIAYVLPSLPTVILPSGLNYDSTNHMIDFTGEMPDDYRDALNFSSDIGYQTAIDALYQMRTLSGTEMSGFISGHIIQILAALRISAQDLELIRQFTGLVDKSTKPPLILHIPAPLTLANLSILCRYAFLAQSLGLSVSDLISLIQLTGFDPIQLTGVDPFRNPAVSLRFVQTVQAIQASPFSVAQLNYLYRDVFDPNAGIAPLPGNVSLLLTTLQAGLASIAHADAAIQNPTGDILLKQLATLLGNSLAGAAMGLINGTGVYSAPLPALLSIDLPASMTYNPATQTLSIVGAMTIAEKTQLLGFSSDPSYQDAINGLFTTSHAGGTTLYTQPLAPLPGITFPSPPSPLSGLIIYDSAAQQLRFKGPMTNTQETALLALSTDTTYQAAI